MRPDEELFGAFCAWECADATPAAAVTGRWCAAIFISRWGRNAACLPVAAVPARIEYDTMIQYSNSKHSII